MPADTPEDDAALFRAAIGDVAPLRDAAPLPQKPRPKPAARMAERDDIDARSEFRRGLDDMALLEAGDALSYRHARLPGRIFQRLRRGQFSVQDELDLHGAGALQAEALLKQFLADAHGMQYGCVRIIHGKGLKSENGVPVLKQVVDRALRQRADVLGFHSAPAAQGGTGAVLVLLMQR